MKVADIKRPPVLLVNEDALTTEISSPQNVYDKETGKLVDILIAPTLIITEKAEGDPKFNLPIGPNMFTEDRYKSFNQFTYSIGKMVRLAELNLDELIWSY